MFTIIILLAAGGFLLYNHFNSKKAVSAWDLVPLETVLVYENGNCSDCVEQIRKSPVTTLIRKAALLEFHDDSLRVFQDLATSFSEPTLVSLHVTRKDEFDFMYYIKKSATFTQRLNVTVDGVMKNKGTRKSQREFDNVVIHEVIAGKKVFSWIDLDNLWVGSFSPVLIEDVIRTHHGSATFRKDLGSVYHLHSVRNDGGNLFINLSNLAQWFGIFTTGSQSPLIRNFGTAALLDTKITGDQIVLNGFSANSENNMFLSAFTEQSPVPFSIRNIISNRALMVASYGLTNGEAFYRRVNADPATRGSEPMDELLKDINEDPVALMRDFSGELAVCWLESSRESLMPLMIIHDSKNISRWGGIFKKIAETKVADTLFVDHYSGYKIFELPAHPFPKQLFAPMVADFSSGYYVQTENSICITADIEELKRFLKDIDQENTWGKSVAQNRFFESTLLEANISLFVNTPKALTMLEGSLQPKWKSFVADNRELISSLGMGAIQFSHLNEDFYTNLSWSLSDVKAAATKPPPSDRFVTLFNSRITSMNIVESHVDRSREVLLQDSSMNLALLSTEGKLLWKLPLPGIIQGQVHQIDYYTNGKLQYLFCTAGQMHVVDRLGNYVKPFPVTIPENNIEFLSVVDYNHSKQYRFMVGSREGNLWIFDKEAKNLEGWQPRRVDGALLTSPNHHRLLGRDYMVAIRKDGMVYLMNRRGEDMPGFPLDLKDRLAGDYYIERGKSAAETTITVVSVDGSKIKFNLQGKVVSREVLVKTALQAKFSLCAEKEGRSYLVMRSEPSQFTVFDENSNEIIKSDFIGSNVESEFLLPGNGRNFVVITDKNQELSYVYDRSGKLLSPIPIESTRIELYPMDNGRIKVFSSMGSSFRVSFLP